MVEVHIHCLTLYHMNHTIIISLLSTEYWQCVCVSACFVSGGAKVTNRLQDRASHPAFGEGNEGEMNCCRWGLYHAAFERGS